MANMKMVLDGLECEEYSKCGKCPYVKFGKCKTLLIRDIRELLKEKEKRIDELEFELAGVIESLNS